MKEFIHKWSNWWILNPKRKQLDEAFEKELNELIEREVALQQRNVSGKSEQLVCPCCGSNKTYRTEAVHCDRCAVTSEI